MGASKEPFCIELHSPPPSPMTTGFGVSSWIAAQVGRYQPWPMADWITSRDGLMQTVPAAARRRLRQSPLSARQLRRRASSAERNRPPRRRARRARCPSPRRPSDNRLNIKPNASATGVRPNCSRRPAPAMYPRAVRRHSRAPPMRTAGTSPDTATAHTGRASGSPAEHITDCAAGIASECSEGEPTQETADESRSY
jgi:hypothetical protein